MNIEGLVRQLGVLFIITFLGWLGVKTKLLPKDTNKVLSALVINITNPCTVLSSVMTGERVLTGAEVWIMVGIAVGFHMVMILLGLGLTKIIGVHGGERSLYQYMTVFGNTGFLGFPVIAALLGKEALFPAAIFVLVFQLFCYTYGVSLFQKSAFQIKSVVNPMIISTLAAFAIYMLELPTPGLVADIMEMVGSVTSPAAMLALGCALASVPVKQVIRHRKAVIFSLLRLTIAPVLVWLLCAFWLKNELMLGVAVGIAAMPVAVNTTLMAAKYDGDEGLAASGVFISTVLCMVTMPIILGLLFG